MIPVILSLVLLQAAPAAAPYPAEEVLATFREVCGEFRNVRRARDRAIELGWIDYHDPADEVYRRVQERLHPDPNSVSGLVVDYAATLRRTVAGRGLILMLIDERYTRQERVQRGRRCALHDYHAPGGLDDAMLRRWAGRPDDGRDRVFGTADLVVWEPGLFGRRAAPTFTTVTYAPEGEILVRGLTITSQLEN
jgi:hypothetical protein